MFMHQHNYVAQNYNIQTDFNNWKDEDECDINAKKPHNDYHLNAVSSVYSFMHACVWVHMEVTSRSYRQK